MLEDMLSTVRRRALAGLGASLAVGCGGEGPRQDTSAGDGILSVGESASASQTEGDADDDDDDGTASQSASGTAETAADASDDGIVFDLGVQPDANNEIEQGCTKVDFLFVIDNSGSMADNQVNLANNFPNFIDGIQATLAEVDEYQVGVITTDAYSPNVAGCNQVGGLIVRTGGEDSSNMVCGPYAAGRNYMTEADDLATEFACAAKVGSDGSGIELVMQAMEIAVRKDLGGPGQCNEGFIRDDALLVIVLITDEWDGPNDPELFGSPGDENTWYDTVVTAKAGIPENVVVLSLIHTTPDCPPSDGFLSGSILPFTLMFGPNGFVGCIDDDYGAIFAQATGIIEEACNNFMPPG